ncbi:MAG: FHA domain-containing protein [Ruminococcaceae bacterium]|nr:FHA domain-containing protein [Oscillospiraceae bacterium]
MANLTRCANGHFYDADKNRTCPYCENATAGGPTTPIQNIPTPPQAPKPQAGEDTGETMAFYGDTDMKVKPVVGWLVSIEGTTAGQDFRLISGRNYIGRAPDMDIVLKDDKRVSRNKHAVVLFDPVSEKALCQEGESRELFYLNGEVVTGSAFLSAGDIITIGDTKLMFVPFCGALHTWNK